MKYIKSYILFVLMVFAVTGCTMDDLKDDVNDLKDRVTLIEQQVKLLNDNLAVIGYILDPQNKTISNVKTQGEGENRQYVITLSNGEQLTLTIGKEGTVNEPEITIGEDGKWYINGNPTGVIAVGENGKNGEGFPEFRVQDGNWQVRFGDGAWANVKGGEGIAGGSSLGDQIFESAEVDGSNFVVTLKDGSVHTLPIVETLVCIIDKTGLTLDAEGFLIVNKDERVVLPVKIEGEKTQVTYPEGWRATLNKLDVADEKGNNYQLLIFAPAAKTRALTRAAADNTADVTVQVQKGSFWAVDKIKVKNPKELNSNLDKYNDNQTITVGGLELTRNLYGVAKEITSDQEIVESGVYFVSTDGVNLTYGLTSGIENLIILPNSNEITSINLTVNKMISFTGTFICSNVILKNNTNYPLSVNAQNTKVVFDKCKIMNLLPKQGLITQPNGNKNVDDYSLNYFEMIDSDIKIEQAGTNLYLLNCMNCGILKFHNNLIYYSGTPAADSNLENFKVFYGKDAHNIADLQVVNNTFIDIESSYTGNNIGLFYPKTLTTAVVKNNIYYFSSYREYTAFLIRVATPDGIILTDSSNNYAYNFNVGAGTLNFNLFQNKVDNKTIPFTANTIDVFDSEDPTTTFDKSNGIFIPKDEYKAYGAQR